MFSVRTVQRISAPRVEPCRTLAAPKLTYCVSGGSSTEARRLDMGVNWNRILESLSGYWWFLVLCKGTFTPTLPEAKLERMSASDRSVPGGGFMGSRESRLSADHYRCSAPGGQSCPPEMSRTISYLPPTAGLPPQEEILMS